MNTKNQKLSIVCLYLANALVYAFNALFYCFLPLYFNARFSSVQAGILLSIGPAVSMIAPVFWGMLADRAKYKNTVLICTILISSVFFFMLGTDIGFYPLCLIIGLTMLFMSPFAGLIDTITLEYTNEHAIAYGPIRVMGTLGFGGISLISSFFTGNSIDIIFYIYVLMAIVCAGVLLLCPKVEGHARQQSAADADGSVRNTKSKKIDLRPLFRVRRLWIIIAFMVLTQFAYSFYCNFFPSYLCNDLGQPDWVWGMNVMFVVVGEIPFFFLYNKVFRTFDIRSIMTVALIGSVIRYGLFGLRGSVPAIVLNNLLTGFLVTVITYCGATYITRYIAPELQATGQNLMYCVGQGLARVFGGFVGGMVNDSFGTTGGMYLISGILAAAAVIFIIIAYRDASPEWKKLIDY
ncbi:MAG: MFS transporter [Eubacteriales bacterium]